MAIPDLPLDDTTLVTRRSSKKLQSDLEQRAVSDTQQENLQSMVRIDK